MTNYARAARAFEDFTGRRPTRVSRAPLTDQDVTGWGMGPLVGVAYEAVRDGKKEQYFHEFAPAARPNLVAREDGRQLFITGGKYTVTNRGIEDMPQLFIVNPQPRRAAAPKRKAMAATKRNAKGRFVKGARAAAKPRRRAARQVAIFRQNPAPKRRRAARVAAPKRRRSFKRNPSGRSLVGVMGLGKMILPAMGVGGGAVGSEILMGYLPIPAAWKTGVMRHVTKGAVGIAAGWGLAHFLKQKKLGFYVMAGAVVIATHDAIKEFIAAKMPSLETAAFGQYITPLPSQFGGMGYVNPARTVRMGQYQGPIPSQFGGVSQAYDNPGGETNFNA